MANRILFLVVLALSIMPRASYGDDSDSNGDIDKKNKARVLATQAVADFRLGALEKAAAEFTESFHLYQSPSTMFNLAQTYRQLKNYEKALYSYRSYLAIAPPDADKQLIKERIADLQNIIEQQRRTSEAPPQDAVAPTAPAHAPAAETPAAALTATAPPTRHDTPVYKKWWLWTIVGVVAVGVGVGVGVGVTQSKGSTNNLPGVTF